MSIILSIILIILMSYIIYYIGEYFANASSNLGDYWNLPKSVKGATFDAISSSMPELMIAIFSVISFGKFEVGIGTIAGSAFFNILIIPAICVLVAPIPFKVSKEVIYRDAKFYIFAAGSLLALVLITKEWGFLIAGILLTGYGAYILTLTKHTKEHRIKNSAKKILINIKKELLTFLITLGIMGFATYILTEQSINLSEALRISPIIIAFTIIAAATSVPDAVVSITNAKKGDIEDATSNAFGSNIFDIFIGLGIPVLLAAIINGSTTIIFENIEVLIALFISSIAIFLLFHIKDTINKKEAIIMLITYAIFFIYIVTIAFI